MKKSKKKMKVRMLKNEKGFSLLEILISLGILASSLTIIMTGVWTTLKFQTKDEELLQAIFLANNKMVEIEAQLETDMTKNKFPQEEEETGEFPEPFENYKWAYAIKKVEIPMTGQEGQSQVMTSVMKTVIKDISKAVRELKLTVMWLDREDEKEKEIVVTTHIVNLQ